MKSFLKKLFLFVVVGLFLLRLPLFSPVFAGNPNADNTIVQISSGPILANGSSTFTVTITLYDDSNTKIPSDSISLSASDGAVNVQPSGYVTLSNGQYTFTLNSNNPATSQLTIHDQTTGTDITKSNWILTFSPTPTQQPTATPIGTCNDATPAAPRIVSAVSGGAHAIILTWNAVAVPVSYYLVSYGASSGNYIYGNPDVGNVTSYTVGSLATGKTYYFAVKAVNGCSPGAYSNEISGAAGVSTPIPSTTDTSGTDVSPTDQTNQSDLTNGTSSDTPVPTQSPPITPVPRPGAVSAGRVAVYSVIGVLLAVSVVVLIFVNKSAKKSRKNGPPSTPPPPDIFNQPNGIDPQEPPPTPNDQSLS